jgi:hypothetical protein
MRRGKFEKMRRGKFEKMRRGKFEKMRRWQCLVKYCVSPKTP